MRAVCTIILICFCLFSCQNKSADINILTDDILIYDIADAYNRTHDVKVRINYLECPDSTIFAEYQKRQIANIDLVIGSYNTFDETDYALYRRNYIPKQSLDDNSYKIRSYSRSFAYFLPYGLDVNVLVLSKNAQNDSSGFITNDEFMSLMNTRAAKNKIVFIPQDSDIGVAEYIFMFNGGLAKNGEYITFDTSADKQIFETYISFDERYNGGQANREEVLNRYANVEKKYFLKKGIIAFDIMRLSKALLLPSDKYEIKFFQDSHISSFAGKRIGITKSDINLECTNAFIDFILSDEIQTQLFRQTMTQTFTKLPINIPINIGDVTDDALLPTKYDFIGDSILRNIKTAAETLDDADFIDAKTKLKFLQAFRFAQTVINNGQLDESLMLEHITASLNQK